jgi:hypothetical protein
VNLTTGRFFRLEETVPMEFSEVTFSETIEKVSPDFCSIYRQADKAEKLQLDLIAGPGYRKALEFLIKDYLLAIYPDADVQRLIRRLQLGPCIENYVKNDKLKQTAKRAVWLGNDETHFVRIWEDKDITDLKDFINLAEHWIEDEAIYMKMLAEMTPPKT